MIRKNEHISPKLVFLKNLLPISVGFTSLFYQVILVKECFSVIGEPRVAFTFPLALWLSGIFVGSWLGERWFLSRIKMDQVLIYLVFVFPFSFFIFQYFGIQDVPMLLLYLLATIVFLPTSFMLGFLYPLLVKELAGKEPNVQVNDTSMSRVYGYEALGMGLGGMSMYCLVDRLSEFYLSGIPVVLLLILIIVTQGGNKLINRRFWIVFILSIVLLRFYPYLERTARDKSMEKWGNVLVYKNSVLGKIHLVKDLKGHEVLLVNRIPIFSTKNNAVRNETFSHFSYLIDSVFQIPSRVLVLGGGTGACAKEFLKYKDVIVDYVEINETLFRVAQEYLPKYSLALPNPRVDIYFQDGWKFIKNTNNVYDIIVIDLPFALNPQVSRFFTREFALLAKKHLTPNGLIMIAPFNSFILPTEEKVNETIVKTYMSVFFKRVLLTTFVVDDIQPDGRQVTCTPYFELVFFSPNAQLDTISQENILSIFRKMKQNGIKYVYMSEMYIKSVFAFTELYHKLRYKELYNPQIKIATIDQPIISFLKWRNPTPTQLYGVKLVFERKPETGEIIPTLYTDSGIWTLTKSKEKE